MSYRQSQRENQLAAKGISTYHAMIMVLFVSGVRAVYSEMLEDWKNQMKYNTMRWCEKNLLVYAILFLRN